MLNFGGQKDYYGDIIQKSKGIKKNLWKSINLGGGSNKFKNFFSIHKLSSSTEE